ncbi:MAG TPA: hypothetical protein VEX35_01550 [Allosphingosinicella sp.]|nr:hypothetical protein [Allosphingosinicella sp.]
MTAGRHNLSRRAVLGVVAGACASHPLAAVAASTDPFALSLSKGRPSLPNPCGKGGLRQAQPERELWAASDRWSRSLAHYRRAEARLAAFRRPEALLPPAARAFPACEPLEERFNDLECARLAALRRLLRPPAPDFAALSLKIELTIDDQAWELTDAEPCLTALESDARRLAGRA